MGESNSLLLRAREVCSQVYQQPKTWWTIAGQDQCPTHFTFIWRLDIIVSYYIVRNLVRVVGFEPTTPWSQTRCATRLRYTRIKTGAPWQNRTAVTWLQNRCNTIILIGRKTLVLSTRIELVMDAYQASVIPFNYKRILVPRDGIEPPTHRFSIYCSTNWATSAKTLGCRMRIELMMTESQSVVLPLN